MRTFLTSLALCLALVGCAPSAEDAAASFAPLEEATCGETVTSILAGQYMTAGTVVVENDGVSLFVTATANTAEGWAFDGMHLYAGPADGIPVNPSGTPIPGHFPYAVSFESPVTSYTFTIPLAELELACGEPLTLALHTESVRLGEGGEVVQTETGWGYGTPFEETNRWGWSFTYELCCDPPEEGEGCTLTQGYWKTHHEEAKRRPLRVDWPAPYDEGDLLCGERALDILQDAPDGGDAWIILAHQFLAARLNVANGASTTEQVDQALADAELWLLDHCEGAQASDAPEALELAAILDAYNNGLVGPGHCD